MAFNNVRRQKFIDEAHYLDYLETLNLYINGSKEELAKGGMVPDALSSFHWALASDLLKFLLLHYTAGRPIAELI